MKHTRFMSAALAATVCLSVSVWAQGGHANALSSQEQKEGWVLLFDGKSLDKWTVTPALAKVWKVADGAPIPAAPATSCRSATGTPATTAAVISSRAAS